MDRERAYPVEGQPVPIEQCVERRHGEVAQVLVVDRVELEAFDQLAHVRHLDLGDPVVGEDGRDALDEPVEIGDVGEHVVRDHHVGSLPLRRQTVRDVDAEELPHGRHPDRLGGIRRTDGGVDPQDGDAFLHEVPQEVAVVARELDHETVGPKVPRRDQLASVLPGVGEQGLGERGVVRVVAEDRLGRHRVLELHQGAARAERDVEGVSGFGLVGSFERDIGIGERHLAEGQEPEQAPCPARSTRRLGAHWGPLPARPGLPSTPRVRALTNVPLLTVHGAG